MGKVQKVTLVNKRSGKKVTLGDGDLKLNVSFGLSPSASTPREEIEKVMIAERLGADMLTDNSIGRVESDKLFEKVAKTSTLPLGVVGAYVSANYAIKGGRGLNNLSCEDFYKSFEYGAKHAGFVEIHPTITRETMVELKRSPRLIKLTSRAAAIVASFMGVEGSVENPYFEDYGGFLDMAKEHDVAIVIGNSLRPGAIGDCFDSLHLGEIKLQKRFTEMAWHAKVPVMVETFGHTDPKRLDLCKITRNIIGAPIGALGPLPTDIATGMDHVAAAIGIVLIGPYLDWISVVTPAEHIDLPTYDDVVEGVTASKVAKHILNLLNDRERDLDTRISEARAHLNWGEMVAASINPSLSRLPNRDPNKPCTMCGPYCPLIILHKFLQNERAAASCEMSKPCVYSAVPTDHGNET